MDLAAAGSGLVAVLVYANTFDADFVYDDTRAIVQNEDLRQDTPLYNVFVDDFWGTRLEHSGSHKSYRPLTTLSFRLNHLLAGGLKPRHFHATNILLHAVATYLLVVYAKTSPLFKKPGFEPLLVGLLFAVHPIHTEAVAGVVGRADVLSAIFFLASLLCFDKFSNNSSRWRRRRQEKTVTVLESNCDKNVGVGNNNYVATATKDHPMRLSPCFTALKRKRSSSSSHHNPLSLKSLVLTAVFAACSMFSKEQGITVLSVCFLTEILRGVCANKNVSPFFSFDKRKLQFLVTSSVALLTLRAYVIGFKAPSFARSDNPAASSDSVVTRALTFLYLPAFNMALLLSPHRLSFDWSMQAIPLVSSASDVRNIITLCFYGVLTCTCLKILMTLKPAASTGSRKRRRSVLVTSAAASISLAILAAPFVPASNLLFYVGFVVAERVLYIPSMGFCLLVALGVGRITNRLGSKGKVIIRLCVAFLVLNFAAKTVLRNNDWRNEENLYRSGLSINPPKALGNLGNVLTQKGRTDQAERAFTKALEFRPNMADVHYNLGVLLQQQNKLSPAIESYRSAIHFRPKLILAHLNLAMCYNSMDLKEEGLAILRNISGISDDGLKDPKVHASTQVSALFNAGKILLDLQRPREAAKVLHEAVVGCRRLRSYPQAQGIYNLLGEVYSALNDSVSAENWFRSALTAKPDHVPAYLTYGKLLAKNKTRLSEAEGWFTKAKELAAASPSAADAASVHVHYGLFLMEVRRDLEAAREFQTAVQINPDDFNSVFNAAVAFRQAGKLDQAEFYYRRTVQLRPNDPSAHMNLGAMFHLVGKLSEAEDHYQSAWQLNPGDPSVKTNLQRLHNIMRAKRMPVKNTPDLN